MAAFGFSVGDFIAFLGVVKDVTLALKESTGSASSYRSLIQTLEALNQALTTSGLIYLQWENIPATETYKKDSQAMINGMLFHRQQCKELIEGFIGSTQPYQNAFLGPFQGRAPSMTRNMRKITWMFQKDKVLKLEKDLHRHLTAIQIYSDGLFQSQMNANAMGLTSNVERILSTIANVQTDTSLISTTLQAWQRPVMSNLGYTWEDTSSLAQSVLLLDAIGRNISLPLMFVSSPNVFHDLLFIMFRGIPGGQKILRREYALTEESEEATIIEESNWGTLIRPGMKMSLNMILRASSSLNTNHCPKCNEATFGPSLPGKRVRCPRCQFTYSIFEHERLVEVEENSFTRPAIEVGDVFFKSNRRPNPNRDASRTLSRARISQKKLVFPEESYFKRVHFHREILKLVSGSAQGFNAPTRMRLVENTAELQIDSLPPLHKAAAQGLPDVIAQLIDDGDDIDSQLAFGAHLEKDGRRCELGGCTPLQLASWYGQLKSINILLDRGADIDKRSSDGKQMLAFAVLGEDPGVVTLLLRRGANINNRDEEHTTALHEACSRSNTVLVHLLLEYGAELEAKTKRLGRTALHIASSRGLDDVVKALLAHDADTLAQDDNGETPLHRASWNKHESIVKILLEYGVDTEIQTKRGYTALHDACTVGSDLVVNILLEHGANVEVQASHGSTALHEAVTGGFTTTVQVIVDSGANLEIQNSWGRTPLHEAALNGHLEVVRYLIQKGAKVLCQDQTGDTPLHSACLQNTHRNVEEIVQILISADLAVIDTQNNDRETPLHLACYVENLDIVRLVVANSSPDLVAAQNKNGETPFYIAASYGYPSIVQYLLEINPKANTVQSTTGRTPLYGSCRYGHPETAEILLKADPTLVNVKSGEGSTPLHEASAEGLGSVVALLLETGAELDAQNNNKDTPLHYACTYGTHEVAAQLLAHGADINIANTDGFLAIHDAACNGKDEFLKILIQQQQDPAPRSVFGITPFHLAASNSRSEAVRILINAGVDIDLSASPLRFAPIHLAVGACHSETIRILAEAGANLDARAAWFGFTPLQMAETADIVQLLLESGADPEVPMTCGLTNEEMAILRGRVDIAKLYTVRSGNGASVIKTRDSDYIKKLEALREEYLKSVKILEQWDLDNTREREWEEEIVEAEQDIKDFGDLLNTMKQAG